MVDMNSDADTNSETYRDKFKIHFTFTVHNSYCIIPIMLYLIQNSPAVKKNGAAPKRSLWRKMWNPRWWPRNCYDGMLMTKFLITTIQVNLCCLLHVSLGFGTKFTWIVVIKNFVISLPSQPFLGRHFWISHLFSQWPFRGHTVLLQLGCFGLDFTSFCNCILCS